MASLRSLLVLFVLSAVTVSPASSQTCSSPKLTNSNLYAACLDLPSLSSALHYSYDAANKSAAVAFVAKPAQSGGWVSWALNPTGMGMVGAQALIAFKDSSTGAMTVKTYNVSSYASVKQSKISFEVWDMSAEENSGDGTMRIYAKFKVPGDASKLNHVWQVGPSVTDGMPDKHDFAQANLASKGTLDLVAGQSTSTADGSRTKKKNIHGILNVVSWGIMFPVGIIIARYVRTFPSADPVWFYLHVSCQFSAYVIGVAGWGTGLKLGSESPSVVYSNHRNIGIALFCLATVQIFALLLRPKKDHKYRTYWNIYHHGVGYAILILGILNIFKGYDILKPGEKWKTAYIIVISILGGIAVFLEAITWIVVLRRRSNKSTKPYDGYNNGQSRQEPLAL
ncbi:cytochrome b561 and DOMON domain-containing protein At3g25290 [Punica granatum]|uniref:Cytochrome b561 and DOMON domain-containing protein n=1 Tax=Punica granatum TaxID=22663 RepID=A0A218VQY2_PUNGR|nr:cytochrome b561 and DOMON domain-containing protein At3g25290 [Punica granatum]OWM62753.1 hypothetical protein CDL15_Pgr020047 [Punica granatum]